MPFRASVRLILLLFIALFPAGIPGSRLLARQSPHLVISELFGGGGNSGAVYTHDFIEVYNPTSSDVVMSNWSVQYQSGSGSGTFTAIARISGTVRSHRFFLIQANPGSGGSSALPTPDAIAGVTLAATSGKVALVSDTLGITGPAGPSVVDFVGYGTANLHEGAAAAIAPGNTTSVERKASASSDAVSMGAGGSEELSGNGRDSDDNGADFLRRDPAPQNDGSPAESPGSSISVSAVYGARWNLVSVPLAVSDPSAGALFPGAQSPLYGWDGGYVGESTAVPGSGYWVRFAGAETVSFTGPSGGADTLSLAPGWNLVGAGPAPVAAAEVVELPEGHLLSAFFGYEEGYAAAETLHPGHAYWVRSEGGGRIVFSTGDDTPAGTGLLRRRVDALPPPPPGAPPPDGDPALRGAEEGGAGTGGAGGLRVDAWPNPFNPSTRIDFSLPLEEFVTVEVADLAGRRMSLLAEGWMGPGFHSVVWDALRAEGGVPAASGAYLVRVSAGRWKTSKKILLVR